MKYTSRHTGGEVLFLAIVFIGLALYMLITRQQILKKIRNDIIKKDSGKNW